MLWLAYLRAAALAGVFFASSLIAGHAVLVRVLRRTLPFEEHLTLALALGVFAFFLEACVFGWLRLYGWPFFVLAPTVLTALGARASWSTLHRLRRHLPRAKWRPRSARERLIIGLGLLGLALLWFPLLSPLNASYDARWYHLPIAENYVARGGIMPFTEGWVHGAFPQLSSLLYAWAFSQPGSMFVRIETAAHIELAVFVMTLFGVCAVTRRLLGFRTPLAWAAMFLFPGLFCYDSGLVLGADHVAALWAAPLFLLALRCAESGSRSFAVLLGAMLAATMNTKYSSVILLPLPLAILGVAALRRSRRAGLLALITALVLSAPTWLRNALFYADPAFPLLRGVLPSSPWRSAAELPYAFEYPLIRPALSWSGIGDMLQTLVTFSFLPHDFPQYHGRIPVFGSLFTLATPLLLLLRRERRLLVLFGGAYFGIAVWFWIHQFDRYLQALLPWMAAGTAAVIALLWQRSAAWRHCVTGVVGLQIAWAGVVPFVSVHGGAGGSIFKAVYALVTRSGDTPPSAYPEWEAMGRALPATARVLIHEEPIHTGLSRATVVDYPGDQGALYWGELDTDTPERIWRRLREHGVTHVLWVRGVNRGADTLAGALVFADFTKHHTEPLGTFAGFALAALRPAPPPPTSAGEVAYFPCAEDAVAPAGLYPLSALARTRADPRRPPSPLATNLTDALERAQYVVFDARCHERFPAVARKRFALLAGRGHAMLMARAEMQ